MLKRADGQVEMTVSPFPPANIELAGEVAQALCAERIGSQRDLGLNRCDAVRCEWDQIRSNFPRSDVDKGNIYRKIIASRPRSHTSLHSQKLERRNKCLPASLTLCPQVDEKQNGVECSWKPAPGAHLYRTVHTFESVWCFSANAISVFTLTCAIFQRFSIELLLHF